MQENEKTEHKREVTIASATTKPSVSTANPPVVMAVRRTLTWAPSPSVRENNPSTTPGHIAHIDILFQQSLRRNCPTDNIVGVIKEATTAALVDRMGVPMMESHPGIYRRCWTARAATLHVSLDFVRRSVFEAGSDFSSSHF